MRILHGALSRRIARFTTSLLVGSLVIASTSGAASAAEPRFDPTTVVTVAEDDYQDAAQHLVDKIQQFDAAYVEDTSGTGRRWTAKVRSHVASGRLQVHLPGGARVIAAKAKVWISSSSSDILVFLPFAGSVSAPSGLTVSLDGDGNVLASMETVFQEVTATSGTVAVWYDGILEGHVLVDASGVRTPVTEPAPPASDVVALGWGDWWDAFEYCLSEIMVVPAWIITGIAIACSVGCFFTAGAACLACIAGAAGGYSFATGYCIAYAFDHS